METPGRARAQHYWLQLALAWGAFILISACGPAGEMASPAEKAGVAEGPKADPRPVVLFLGTSLTAGYGLPSDQAFPALLQGHIDAEGLPYQTVNAGVSGDTSAGGLRRLDWLLRQPIAVLVLELGANDMLRGQGVDAMRKNLQKIVDQLRAEHPTAKLLVAGMRAAPNLGESYAASFEASYSELVERNDGVLIPFLLEGVAADPDLNQADGIHPTSEGHAILAETVWKRLLPVLKSVQQERGA